MSKNAFVLRMSYIPSLVKESLETDKIQIGWPSEELHREDANFRDIIHKTYYPDDKTMHRTGSAVGHLWRFIHEMQDGDFIVVPHSWEGFYVAEVSGKAVPVEKGHVRQVIWRNNKNPIPRKHAHNALQMRMKAYGTCSRAGDLRDMIEECVINAETGKTPEFYSDLREVLAESARQEMLKGRINDFGFEELIGRFLKSQGGKNVSIIPRKVDKGADVVATFTVAGLVEVKIAVQAKQWREGNKISIGIVEKLVEGAKEESADVGVVITTGETSDEVRKFVENECEMNISLIEGTQFAELILDSGLGSLDEPLEAAE